MECHVAFTEPATLWSTLRLELSVEAFGRAPPGRAQEGDSGRMGALVKTPTLGWLATTAMVLAVSVGAVACSSGDKAEPAAAPTPQATPAPSLIVC